MREVSAITRPTRLQLDRYDVSRVDSDSILNIRSRIFGRVRRLGLREVLIVEAQLDEISHDMKRQLSGSAVVQQLARHRLRPDNGRDETVFVMASMAGLRKARSTTG